MGDVPTRALTPQEWGEAALLRAEADALTHEREIRPFAEERADDAQALRALLAEVKRLGSETLVYDLIKEKLGLRERMAELEHDFAKALRMIPLAKISQEDIEWARAVRAEPADA